MPASAFPAHARAASKLLFGLAAVAALLGVIFVAINVVGEGSFLRVAYGDGLRAGIYLTLVLLGLWVLMVTLLAMAGLGLRLLAAFAEEVAGGSAELTEALRRREPAE